MNLRHVLISILMIFAGSFPSYADTQTWYFVRHFEKQIGDNPHLTKIGQARAKQLAEFFASKEIHAIYSTHYNRTQQTATPVAESKSLEILTYNPSQLSEFAEELKSLNFVLVVGHSNTTPELLELMGGEVIHMEESDYGVVYQLQNSDGEFTTQSDLIPSKLLLL